MKKILYLIPLCIIVFLLPVSTVMGLEIGTAFHIGNLAFEKARTSDQTGFDGTSFPWGIDAFINQDVSSQLDLHTGFYMDPILKNISYTLFSYQQNFFSIGVGPFFGLFNSSSSILKPGISTSIRLDFPGIIFVSFRADSSIGGRLVQTGDYLQERSDISIGYYVRNAICSVNIKSKKYTAKSSAGELVDSLTSYSFSTDIFQKNMPYKILLSFGYQKLTKIFIEGDTTAEHTLGSLVIANNLDIFINDYLTVFIDLESSVYSFGSGVLLGISNPGPGGYLFNASTGVTLNLDAFKKD